MDGVITDKSAPDSRARRILVVDDEPNVVRSLTFVLNKEGYNVSSAINGEEAMLKIQETKPNLIFLDVMMPKKNGYEVCKEVKSNSTLSNIHVIMLTARGQAADREKGLDSGADEFMTKPFSLKTVVDRAKEILG